MRWGTLATDLQDLLYMSFLSGQGLECCKFEGMGQARPCSRNCSPEAAKSLLVCAMETTCLLMCRAGARHGQIVWSCLQSTHDLFW